MTDPRLTQLIDKFRALDEGDGVIDQQFAGVFAEMAALASAALAEAAAYKALAVIHNRQFETVFACYHEAVMGGLAEEGDEDEDENEGPTAGAESFWEIAERIRRHDANGEG